MPPRASRAKAAPVPPPPELETLDLRAEECHDLKGIEGMSRDSMHTLLIALGIPFEPRWVKKDLAPLLREGLFKKLFFVTVECDRANKSGVLRVPRTTPISECIKMTNDMLARHGYVVNDATMVLTHGGERVESLLDVDFGAPLSIIGSYRQLAQVSQPAASSEDARDVAHDPGEMFLIWVKCPVAEFTGVASCAVTRGIKVYNNTYMAEVRYMLPTLEIAAKTQDYALTFMDEILCDTATICSKGIKPLNTIVMRLCSPQLLLHRRQRQRRRWMTTSWRTPRRTRTSRPPPRKARRRRGATPRKERRRRSRSRMRRRSPRSPSQQKGNPQQHVHFWDWKKCCFKNKLFLLRAGCSLLCPSRGDWRQVPCCHLRPQRWHQGPGLDVGGRCQPRHLRRECLHGHVDGEGLGAEGVAIDA